MTQAFRIEAQIVGEIPRQRPRPPEITLKNDSRTKNRVFLPKYRSSLKDFSPLSTIDFSSEMILLRLLQ